MATRRQHVATNAVLKDCIAFLKGQGFDLVIVETAGIGQSDSEIVDLVDFPMYVMTSDYGAASQLEKIDMLDFADLVVLNKYDRRGAEDALRDVRKQWRRNRTAFKLPDEQVPVYPTIASQFNDPGVTWMFVNLCRLLREKLHLGERGTAAAQVGATPSPPNPPLEGEGLRAVPSSSHAPSNVTQAVPSTSEQRQEPSPSRGGQGGDGARDSAQSRCDFNPHVDTTLKEPRATVLIPGARVRYLAEIAEQGRGINTQVGKQAEAADRAQAFWQTLKELGDPKLPRELDLYAPEDLHSLPPPAGEDARRAEGGGKAPKAPAPQPRPLSPTPPPQGGRG
jgi:methylmalonyl-CoA mutase